MKKLVLLLLGTSALSSHAQSPGGIDGTDLWFKPVPTTFDLQGNYHWQDCSGDSTLLSLYSVNGMNEGEFIQAREHLHTFNFHPAFHFSDGQLIKAAKLKRTNLSQATVFGVFASLPDTYDSDQLLYVLNSGKQTGVILSKDKIIRSRGTTPLDYGDSVGEDLLYITSDSMDAESFKENALRITAYQKADRSHYGIWGEPSTSNILVGTTYTEGHPLFNAPFDASLFKNAKFDGYTPEVIIYSRYLTPIERKKIESYLAVKYGITLKGSYLDSEGNLLWDRDRNSTYHHRVTAIGKDLKGSLYQPVSTTSYEEAPNFSTLKQNDCFHERNLYAQSSAKRLLVIGREEGNPLPDKGYLFWGDDNRPLGTYTSSTDSLWHIMNRNWIVQGNIPVVIDSTSTHWTGNGLIITKAGFTDCIRQETAAAGAFASTATMEDCGGSIAFRCPFVHPSFEVGFAAAGDNTCRYGFRFNADGSVFTIQDFQLSSTTIATDINGSTISIRREKNIVYLQIDGTGNQKYTIRLSDADKNLSLGGIIRTLSAETPLVLSSVRTGGIGDTGYMVELSHALTPNKEFLPYCRNRSVILIDPTASGQFDKENTRIIRCSQPDILRGKTIFHHVFWDADGSGSDLFTFAYFDGLSADATVTPSSCENGKSQNNGSIDIGIQIGTPIYNYILVADSVAGISKGTLISNGKFIGETHHVEGLAPGSYQLQITQGGGNDIHGTGGSLYTTYAHDNRVFSSGEFSWTITGTQSNYRIGVEPRLSNDITQFGFDVRGNRAHLIIDGHTSLTQYYDIKEGDELGVALEGITVAYKLNGKVIHRLTKWNIRMWRLCVKFGSGETHITGLTINGEPVPEFTYNGSVQIETPKTHTVSMKVYVGSECDASLPNGTEKSEKWVIGETVPPGNGQHVSDESLQIEGNATGIYDAILKQDNPEETVLVVFDISGKRVFEQQMNGEKTKRAQFSVPLPGVYIVKAISMNQEHTRKISVK